MIQGKRLEYIDIAKGIGMLTIIWGHINSGPTNLFVYSFHIPLFFFLSGLVYKEAKYPIFKEFAIKKVKTLVIPYLVFSFLTWLVWAAFCIISHRNTENYLMPLVQTFIAQGSQGFLVHNVPLWFVPCLLLVETLFYFINKIGKKPFNIITICIMFALSSYAMEKSNSLFDFTLLPWSMGAAFANVLFYGIGYLLMKNGYMDRMRVIAKVKVLLMWFILMVATLSLALLTPLNGSISVGHERYNNRILFYLDASLGIFCVILFSILVEQYSSEKGLQWIRWIGQNSIYFLFVENPIKGFIIVALGKINHISELDISRVFGYSAIAFIISVFVSIIIVKYLLLIKNKYLIFTGNARI